MSGGCSRLAEVGGLLSCLSNKVIPRNDRRGQNAVTMGIGASRKRGRQIYYDIHIRWLPISVTFRLYVVCVHRYICTVIVSSPLGKSDQISGDRSPLKHCASRTKVPVKVVLEFPVPLAPTSSLLQFPACCSFQSSSNSQEKLKSESVNAVFGCHTIATSNCPSGGDMDGKRGF